MTYPYPEDEGQTHYEGCWRERGHHNCAVKRAEGLRDRVEQLKSGQKDLLDNVANSAETIQLLRAEVERLRAGACASKICCEFDRTLMQEHERAEAWKAAAQEQLVEVRTVWGSGLFDDDHDKEDCEDDEYCECGGRLAIHRLVNGKALEAARALESEATE